MNLDGLHLRQLAYLASVAEVGSFGDAADVLGVSQPALSQGLARLEGLIGAPLFEPDGRRRRLTSLGEEVADYASRVIGETRQLQAALASRREGESGRLRVGMIDAAILYLLDVGVDRFRRDRPQVELQLTVGDSGTLLRHLTTFQLDLAYVVGPVEGAESTPIAEEALYIYGSPLPKDLAAAAWVLYPAGSKTRAAIETALVSRGIRPRVVGESGNPRVLRQLVHLGIGWTVLPAEIAETGANPLTRRSDAIGSRMLHAAWREAAGRDDLVATFRGVVESRANA